jgi:hypothetical protein
MRFSLISLLTVHRIGDWYRYEPLTNYARQSSSARSGPKYLVCELEHGVQSAWWFFADFGFFW